MSARFASSIHQVNTEDERESTEGRRLPHLYSRFRFRF